MMIYKRTDSTIGQLVSAIQTGSIGLPELQRPFVWGDSKARDLLKSIIKGYPIGFLILWTQPEVEKSKQIGTNVHAYSTPNELIIDGQQRLTSLYSIITGTEVLDESYKRRRIVISYCPSTGEVEVANEALRKSSDWIYDITTVFTSGNLLNVAKQYVDGQNEAIRKSGGVVDESASMVRMAEMVEKLSSLKETISSYLFPVLTISKDADEENVADIFVNINSGGTALNQSDFILTLVSVHYPEGRRLIEDFCRRMKKHPTDESQVDLCNPIVAFDPADIIRVTMAYGFKRGRLRYAYKLLRGADFEKKGAISEELRNSRFDAFKKALDEVIDPNHLKEFLKCVNAAGFVKSDLLPSKNNIVYAYAFWLIGKLDFNIGINELKKTISRVVYFFNLTSRYSNSFEGLVEGELTELADRKDSGVPNGFEEYFENVERTQLTNDFFKITLVENLKSSSNRNPSFLTYIAAQNILDARVLFSKPSISTLTSYSNWINDSKKAVELHHLFPKNYLKNIGFKNKDINQVGNYAFIEWATNLDISDDPPSSYFKGQIAGMSQEEVENMERLHALPFGWEDLNYPNFLAKRRELMASIIRAGYEKLKN